MHPSQQADSALGLLSASDPEFPDRHVHVDGLQQVGKKRKLNPVGQQEPDQRL
jgi:hypothetical protein